MAKLRKYKKGQNIKLSRNFHLSEYECKDPAEYENNNWVIVDLDHVEKLQKLRERIGKPIKITSAYRTPEWNAKVGGSTKSRHKEGDATDIQVPGMDPAEVADIAEEMGFDGIGRYNSFTHLDSRGYKARWNFTRKAKEIKK